MEKIAKLLHQYRQGKGLPAAFYTSNEIFKFDVEQIFKKTWIYVGVVSEFKKKGEFRVVQVDNNSIILVRDEQGDIRAFHNSCRHRGAQICVTEKGNVPKLVCPYHQWVYGLNGDLIYAGRMGESFSCKGNGLKPVAIESIAGLLFINLSKDPSYADIEKMKTDLAPYVGFYQLDRLKVAKEIDIIEQANWKLVVENNRECYHCNANHPELLKSWPPFGAGFGWPDDPREAAAIAKKIDEAYAVKRPQWDSMGMTHEPLDLTEDRWYRAMMMILENGALSQTMNGELACKKLLPGFTEPDNSDLSMWTHFNSWHHFMCDHVVTTMAIPISESETLVRTRWLVHEDAQEGVDYDLDNLTHVWVQTNDQDRWLAEINHAGIRSDAYQPGQYSEETEGLVMNFIGWYIKQLQSGI